MSKKNEDTISFWRKFKNAESLQAFQTEYEKFSDNKKYLEKYKALYESMRDDKSFVEQYSTDLSGNWKSPFIHGWLLIEDCMAKINENPPTNPGMNTNPMQDAMGKVVKTIEQYWSLWEESNQEQFLKVTCDLFMAMADVKEGLRFSSRLWVIWDKVEDGINDTRKKEIKELVVSRVVNQLNWRGIAAKEISTHTKNPGIKEFERQFYTELLGEMSQNIPAKTVEKSRERNFSNVIAIIVIVTGIVVVLLGILLPKIAKNAQVPREEISEDNNNSHINLDDDESEMNENNIQSGTNEEIHADYEKVYSAYTEFFVNQLYAAELNNVETIYYEYAYLNNDEIPELFITSGTDKGDSVYLYIYSPYSEDIKLLGEYSDEGKIYVREKYGIIGSVFEKDGTYLEVFSCVHGDYKKETLDKFAYDFEGNCYYGMLVPNDNGDSAWVEEYDWNEIKDYSISEDSKQKRTEIWGKYFTSDEEIKVIEVETMNCFNRDAQSTESSEETVDEVVAEEDMDETADIIFLKMQKERRIRSEKSLDGEELITVPVGEVIELIIPEEPDGWGSVKYQDITGYMYEIESVTSPISD